MSARPRLLLPVPAILLTLSACTVTATPAPVAATDAPAGAEGARADGCPSARTLEGLADLPEGWSFDSVTCAGDWAAADPRTPTPADGFYLFKKSGADWKYHSEGSGYECEELGLTEAPFCVS